MKEIYFSKKDLLTVQAKFGYKLEKNCTAALALLLNKA